MFLVSSNDSWLVESSQPADCQRSNYGCRAVLLSAAYFSMHARFLVFVFCLFFSTKMNKSCHVSFRKISVIFMFLEILSVNKDPTQKLAKDKEEKGM